MPGTRGVAVAHMTTEPRESGHTYEAAAGIVLPSLEDLPGVATVSGPESETLRAEYYDTEDLRLLVAGVTLRRREGGTDGGWHLKLPDDVPGTAGQVPGTSSRREIQMPLARGDRSRGASTTAGPVPGELARLVLVHSRGAALRPVARLETRRRRTTLRGSGGESLAEVVADEVAAQTLGASSTRSRWNEVEVELTDGSPQLLREVADRLRRGGLHPAERATKLEHAFAASLHAAGGSGTDPRRVAEAGRRVNASSPADDVVLAYLAAQAARLKALDPAIRRDEPDAIHQMRVTTRRLRAALQAFPMIVASEATRHLHDELKWLGTVLGAARDIEVLQGTLQAALAATPAELVLGPAKARVTAHFAPREEAAREAVLDALESQRYFRLFDELDRLLDDPPEVAAAPAVEILPHAVGQAFRRARRRMRQAWLVPPGPARDALLHEARKAAKRARYAAEAAQPAIGKKARRFATGMKAVQSILGDHHDAITTREAAQEIGVQAHLAGENAFSFGLLTERAHHEAQEYQRQARKAWKRATRGKARRWLR
jgi:CHAD domain-containing protein